MSILKNLSQLSNGPNVVGGSGVTNSGGLTSTTGAVANGGNTSYGGSGSRETLLTPNRGLYEVRGGAHSPSSVHKPFPPFTQGGGGRSRRKSRKNRHRRAGKSRSRSNKRSLKYRVRHKRGSRSRSRSRRGGEYAQFMTGIASSFGQSMPGYPLSSKMSALANPPPFQPYQNCPGGR